MFVDFLPFYPGDVYNAVSGSSGGWSEVTVQ